MGRGCNRHDRLARIKYCTHSVTCKCVASHVRTSNSKIFREVHNLTADVSDKLLSSRGWQVSANSGLNRGLNRFKLSWQKQVFDSFYQTWYNNCSSKINNLG